jgi:glycosyltransferase involved in cell wall biosynthesis
LPYSREKVNRRVIVLSPVDYPFYSATSRRISGIVGVLNHSGVRTEVICPVFRFSTLPALRGVTGIDLRRLRSLGAETLITRALALTIFNVVAFAKLLLPRSEILAVQYESILTFPAALLTKIFLRCPCFGEDINTPPILRRLVFFEPAVALASNFITSSLSNISSSRLSKCTTIFVPTAVTEELVIKRKQITFDRIRAIFVGTLSYSTNLRAINHISRIDSLIPIENDCILVVVGGPIPTGLRPSRRMRLLGHVTDSLLRRTYNQANVGLLPFFGTRTGGAKSKLIEYMAAQLLVISSPEGVEYLPELVPWVHFVPAASAEEMAQLISTIPRDAKRFRRIAMNGHKHVMQRYRWRILLRSYLRFIEDLRSNN